MPNIIGLDLSLTSTGYVTLDEFGEVVNNGAIKSKQKGIERLIELRDGVTELVPFAHQELVDLIVIEGYAFGAQNQAAYIGELGGVVKVALHELGREMLIVPPAKVKQFATGKGNARKDMMRLEVFKRWGFEAKTDDEIDAYALARIGYALMYKDDTLTQAQRDVIEKLR